MMQTHTDISTSFSSKLERIAKILRLAGWAGFWIQLFLGVVSGLMLMLAIGGRNFNRSMLTAPRFPGYGINPTGQTTTPGLGIGVFWAVCGIAVLLGSIYFAFRQTRFAKRLRHPNPSLHPKKLEIIRVLELSIMVGLVGMLVTILGGGASLGVLLSKSIAQPQGVAIYDPTRVIRSLDIFVAMANMTGITAHFVGVTASLGLWRWLHQQ